MLSLETKQLEFPFDFRRAELYLGNEFILPVTANRILKFEYFTRYVKYVALWSQMYPTSEQFKSHGLSMLNPMCGENWLDNAERWEAIF